MVHWSKGVYNKYTEAKPTRRVLHRPMQDLPRPPLITNHPSAHELILWGFSYVLW